MSKKIIAITIAVVVLFVLLAMVGYFNHDKINELFNEEVWVIKEPFQTSITSDIVDVSAGNYLAVYTKDGLRFYNSRGTFFGTESISSSKVKLYSKDAYTLLFAEDTNTLYLYKDKSQLWKKDFKNEIRQVNVNSNGYVSLCFSQNGYKSGVTVYGPNGSVVLNKYLANDYATCAILSNDAKKLYISETNLSSIKPQSYVSVIEVSSSANEISKTKISNNEIITDISISKSGKIFVLTDKSIYSLEESNYNKLYEFSEINTFFSSITGVETPFVIEQIASSNLTNNAVLKRMGLEENAEVELNGIPQTVSSSNDKIALRIGSEVYIYNSISKLVGKIDIKDNVLKMEFMNDARELALIYRNKIEFIKL